jgi:hypothetical protein
VTFGGAIASDDDIEGEYWENALDEQDSEEDEEGI